jgi:hypothetical protein
VPEEQAGPCGYSPYSQQSTGSIGHRRASDIGVTWDALVNMSDSRDTARELPLAIFRLLDSRISANRNLRSMGRRDAFKKLNAGYNQLLEAMNGHVSLGTRYFETFLTSDWLTEANRHELQQLFEIHRAFWDLQDDRKKQRSSITVGNSDLLSFKRTVNDQHPDIARRFNSFVADIDAFNFLCDKYIEQERISGKAKNALTNGVCICLWLRQLDDESNDFHVLLASALRLTIYAAFYIHDLVIFRRLLNELKQLSEKSRHPWIASAFHQNDRRLQVNFGDIESRNITQIVVAGQKAHETALDSKRSTLPQSVLSMWTATPLLAHQAFVQSLVLSRQITERDLQLLKDAKNQFTDSGFNTDATLITKMVMAEAYIHLKKADDCEEQLLSVEARLSRVPHRFEGIRAVARRISGDLELFRFSANQAQYDESTDKAKALYEQSRFHFVRSGNAKVAAKLAFRTKLANEISSFSGAVYTEDQLLDDFRFREPIW